MSSTFALLKNQKYPVSPVSTTACPAPDVPSDGARHTTATWNRPPFKQSVCGPGAQGAIGAEARDVNAPAIVPLPPSELRTTASTGPPEWGGVVTSIRFGSIPRTVAGSPPNSTA